MDRNNSPDHRNWVGYCDRDNSVDGETMNAIKPFLQCTSNLYMETKEKACDYFVVGGSDYVDICEWNKGGQCHNKYAVIERLLSKLSDINNQLPRSGATMNIGLPSKFHKATTRKGVSNRGEIMAKKPAAPKGGKKGGGKGGGKKP